MGKKHLCFFQTAETGNRTPNSGVKGSGANHYPRAPAQQLSSTQANCRSFCFVFWDRTCNIIIFVALNNQLLQIKYIVVFYVCNLRNYFKTYSLKLRLRTPLSVIQWIFYSDNIQTSLVRSSFELGMGSSLFCILCRRSPMWRTIVLRIKSYLWECLMRWCVLMLTTVLCYLGMVNSRVLKLSL